LSSFRMLKIRLCCKFCLRVYLIGEHMLKSGSNISGIPKYILQKKVSLMGITYEYFISFVLAFYCGSFGYAYSKENCG
jgi:hypothetical protein